MHTIRNAIILAAGFGSRLLPITLETPKPLVRVRGLRMIDTAIRALHANSITEIWVVVGHKKEQFRGMEEEYPGLHLIENPHYETSNNISSLYVAREHLGDTMILEGDLIINEPAVLSPQFERSGYTALWTDLPTKEWVFDVEDGLIRSCSRTGGPRGWQLLGVSRWTGEDSAVLRRLLELEFVEKNNRGIFWDDVVLFCHPDRFSLGIRPMRPGDIVEIDSYQELRDYDPGYREEQ